MLEKLVDRFKGIYRRKPEVYSSAPGRINIIGEHTDYNLGYVLPAAVHLRTHALFVPREDEQVRVFSENFAQQASFNLNHLQPASDRSWIKYVEGIFWVLLEQGNKLKGADILVKGDLPLEAGLSSSASLEICLLQGLLVMINKDYPPPIVAKLGQKAENEYVGVRCGLMDQFIAVLAKEAMALFLDCEFLDYEYVPLRLEKEDLVFLIYDTRVPRQLAGSKYNERRTEAQRAREILFARGFPSIKFITLEQLDILEVDLDPVLFRRARHVVSENQRVLRAKEALQQDDFNSLGQLLFASHSSLKNDYEVSCPELDLFVDLASRTPGCLGARLVGAGFGGSAIALIKKEAVEALMAEAKKQTARNNFPQPQAFIVSSGPRASAWRF